MGHGALGKKFDAYPQRQFVTESSYNNSLAYHHIWSTIKTLPATLPEPCSMDRGPRTGVTEGVSLSDLDFIEGWGKIFDKNMFLLDRPFPATPDFRVFGENVALGRGHV